MECQSTDLPRHLESRVHLAQVLKARLTAGATGKMQRVYSQHTHHSPNISRRLCPVYEPLYYSFGVERDAYIPTLIASLEWGKYVGAGVLPTMFMAAQLDWFGAHAYEKWDGEAGRGGGVVKKGSEHYEWKAA